MTEVCSIFVGETCACFCFLGEQKNGCNPTNFQDYMNDAVGLDIECELCDDPAGYENVDFYYTYGLNGDGSFSSCIPNLCSELEAQICGPGETLLVRSCACEPHVLILA